MDGTRQSQRLLVIGCSYRKRADPAPLPATERYDGPAFRLLRRFAREAPSGTPAIYVLSAQYGLIPGERSIRLYDRVMTRQRALELQPALETALEQIVRVPGHREVFVHAGGEYRRLLEQAFESLATGCAVRFAVAGPGRKLAELHDWLYGRPPQANGGQTPMEHHSRSRRCVAEPHLTAEHVLALAREALQDSSTYVPLPASWYVEVDGRRVPPKWLLSVVTGRSRSELHTDQARRVLARLGIPVRRM